MTFWQYLIGLIPGVRAAWEEAKECRQMALESSQRAAALQSENSTLREMHGEMWARLDAALAAERNAHQMAINVEYQQRYGFAPYPTAPMMPDSVKREMKAMAPDFINGRTLAQKLERQERSAMEEYFRQRDVDPVVSRG